MRSDDEQRPGTIIYATEQTLQFPSTRYTTVAADTSSVPLSIFSSELSALQALVRYLHERELLPFSEIGTLLNRSQKTIWTTYQQAKDQQFSYVNEGLTIPIEQFASRALAPLETLVIYLAQLGFSNVDTARILNLDPRTTWTAKRRAKKKGVML